MKTNNFLLVLLLSLLIISSCNKDGLVEFEKEELNTEFSLKDDYLHFSDWDAFNLKLVELNNMQSFDFESFEQELGFSSFYSNYRKFQMEYDERMKQGDVMLSSYIHLQAMYEIADKYPTAIVAKFDDGGVYTRTNIFDESFSRIVNIAGQVAIGNQLYVFGENRCEILKSLDNSKLKGAIVPDGAILKWSKTNDFIEDGSGTNKYKLQLGMRAYSDGKINFYGSTYHSWNLGISWNEMSMYPNPNLYAEKC
ncbi:MAG: DUF4848 domain-containing protein [Chloroflexia bacterium]|nr:DUF4848 domain-containing protein [Chloroflexia bacterium]